MATQYDTQIQQLYVAYFNRPADAGGIAHWANFMANGGTAAQISAAFAQSLEYQVEYSQTNNAGIVNAVYQNLFGRPAETEGLAFWVKALTDKTMTVDNMVLLISQGAQGTDKTAYESKVTVATAFTNALDTDAEKAGYSGADANEAAKEMLAKIKTTAQATAAIEKAALDASVAAVIKAATPFTLENGLAALSAANAAVETFLEDFAEANDLDEAAPADVTGAVTAAKADLVTLIEDEDFATASAGVQDAMIADQEELNDDTLVAANKALTAANTKVGAVTGLANAISAAKSAEAGVEAAELDVVDAYAAFSSAQITLMGRNPSVEPVGGSSIESAFALVDTLTGKTIAEVVDGEVKIPSGIVASNYVGLTAFVAAANVAMGAQMNLVEAQEASTLAQLRAELLEAPAGSLAGDFTFSATKPATPNAPSYNVIVNELSALSAELATAEAALAAAPEDTDTEELEAAVTEAQEARDAFYGQIVIFNAGNPNPLATAVAAAEKGTLVVAQEAVAEIAGLSAAIAADAEYVAMVTVAIAAQDDEVEAATALETDNDGLVVVDGIAEVDGVAIVELDDDGKLAPADEVVVGDYEGLAAYIAAFNASVDADTAVEDAELSEEQLELLSDEAVLVGQLAAAQGLATSQAMADRVKALGTEGAQAAIDALAEALEALEDAQAAADELEALQDAVADVVADFAAEDYAAPVTLGVSNFGTTDADIFVAGTVNSTVTNFGRSGDDVLYVGAGYTLNDGAVTTGDDAVLEVFMTQRGNNAVITIESKAYGSDSGDVHTVTLTGVNVEDLTFENGIITL